MQTLPTWYLTILLYFAAATAYSLLQRHLAQHTKVPLNLIPALVFGFFAYPCAVIYSFIIGNIHIMLSPTSISLLLAAGLFAGSANALFFRFNKHVDATQYVIINNIYTPLTVALGTFVLKEAFTGKQFVGMFLLLFGAVLVAAKGFKPSTLRFDKYSLGLALTSLVLGLGLFAERASLNYMSSSAYLIYGWGIQTIVAFIFAWRALGKIPKITKHEWIDIFKVGIARTGHVIGFFLSVAFSRNVALIASISSFRIPLVFIASFFILHERDHLVRKLIGVIIATIGLILL